MKKVLFIFSILMSLESFSQAPAIQWQKTFGGTLVEDARSVKQTSDGGYIIAGRANSTNGDVTGIHGNEDCWVVKINNTGTIQWQKTYGGTADDFARNIIQTSDGGYVIVGLTYSNDGDVTGHHGSGTLYSDVWIIKINSAGVLQWQKALGGTYSEDAWNVRQTSDGGYIIAADTGSNDGDVTLNQGGSRDAWIIKLSNTGDIQWQKTYGGSNEDTAHCVLQTIDGGYLVTVQTSSFDGDVLDFHGGQYDIWLIKLSSTGTIQWQKNLGGTLDEWVYSIEKTSDGGYVIGAYSSSTDMDVVGNHGFYDVWVIKLDSAGTVQWKKTFGGTNGDYAYKIEQTTDNGYIIAGYTNSNNGQVSGNHGARDMWVIKINNVGTLQWQKTMGGTLNDIASDISRTTDNGYIVAGISESVTGDVIGNNGGADFWVVKLAPDALGTTSFQHNQLSIYPNPSNDVLNIQLSEPLTIDKINVVDISGKTLMEETQNTNINIENLASGIYMIKVFSGSQTFQTKFVKQ